jgi:hypothetical protein
LAQPNLARHRGPCRVLVSPLGPDVVPMGGAALAMDALVAAPDAWTPPPAVWAGSGRGDEPGDGSG